MPDGTAAAHHLRVSVVVGNPKPRSRTLAVASAAIERLAGLLAPGAFQLAVLDLAERAPEMFDPGSVALGAWAHQVAGSDLVLFASPTYKGTYTGLLKSFADRFPSDGLGGVVAIGLMTGAASVHALAPEVHLRPLLVELGATVPARSLYLVESEFAAADAVVDRWCQGALPLLRRALGPATAREPGRVAVGNLR